MSAASKARKKAAIAEQAAKREQARKEFAALLERRWNLEFTINAGSATLETGRVFADNLDEAISKVEQRKGVPFIRIFKDGIFFEPAAVCDNGTWTKTGE